MALKLYLTFLGDILYLIMYLEKIVKFNRLPKESLLNTGFKGFEMQMLIILRFGFANSIDTHLRLKIFITL